MQKKKKGILISFIAMCILLVLSCSACNDNNKEEETSKVSFIEQEVVLPEDIDVVFDIEKRRDGTLELVGFNEDLTKGTVWESKDKGDSWEKISEFTKKLKIEETTDTIPEAAGYISPKGEVLSVVVNWDKQDDSMDFFEETYLIKNDQVTKLNLDFSNDEKERNAIYSAAFSENGDLIIEDNEGQLYKVDKTTGKVEMSFLPENLTDISNSFAVDKEVLYALTDKGLKAYSIKSGKELKLNIPENSILKIDDIEDAPRNQIAITSTDSDALTIASINSEGLFRYTAEGKDLLLPGNKTCLSSSNTTLYDFISLDSETYFLIAQMKGGSKLFKYSKDNAKQASETLTIYSLKDNVDIDETLYQFQRKNPQVDIKKEIGISEENGVTESDALKKLNTQILAGEGPDLIYLDNLSVDNFFKSGLLENVSDVLKPYLQRGELLENISKSYTAEENIYAVPSKFSFIAIEGNKELVKNSGNMSSLIKKMNENKIAINKDYFSTVMMLLYRAYLSADIFYEAENIESVLKNFYADIKGLYVADGSEDVLNEMDFYRKIGMMPYAGSELLEVVDKQIQVSINYILDTNDLKCLKKLKSEKLDYKVLGEAGTFVPMNIIGINSKSDKIDLAKEYLSFAIATGGQSHLSEVGFPINKEVLMERLGKKSDTVGFGNKEIKLQDFNKSTQELIVKKLEGFKTPLTSDNILAGIIIDPIESLLRDEATVNNVANTAVQKWKLYQAE